MSAALMILFLLLWISIAQQFEELSRLVPEEEATARLIFMALAVFFSSFALFRLNFFWLTKRNHYTARNFIAFQVLLNLAVISLIVLIIWLLSMTEANLVSKPGIAFLLFMRTTALAMVTLLVTYNYDASERSKLDKIKLLAMENEKMQAELGALKAQVDPHYLFNSLNSLTGVIRQDQKEAIHFVNHLSHTMRYTLDKKDLDLVTLKEELEFMKSYEYMMKIRFGAGFVITHHIAQEHLGRKLPQFALQLLIENAIKHNRVSIKSPLEISIRVEDQFLEVKNNLQPKASVPKGYGFGLANLSKRYELLELSPIDIQKTADEFTVKLSLT